MAVDDGTDAPTRDVTWGTSMMLAHNLNKLDPKKSPSFGSLHSLAEDEVFGWNGSSPFAGSPETTGWLHDSGFNSLPSSPSQMPRFHRSSSRTSGDSSPKILSDFLYEKPAQSPTLVSLIPRDSVDFGSLLFQDEFGKVYAATWIGVKTRVRIINVRDQGMTASALCERLSNPIRHPFIESQLGCVASSENPSTEVWAMTEAVAHQLPVRPPHHSQRPPRAGNALPIHPRRSGTLHFPFLCDRAVDSPPF